MVNSFRIWPGLIVRVNASGHGIAESHCLSRWTKWTVLGRKITENGTFSSAGVGGEDSDRLGQQTQAMTDGTIHLIYKLSIEGCGSRCHCGIVAAPVT